MELSPSIIRLQYCPNSQNVLIQNDCPWRSGINLILTIRGRIATQGLVFCTICMSPFSLLLSSNMYNGEIANLFLRIFTVRIHPILHTVFSI
jgi:hypothetical protein